MVKLAFGSGMVAVPQAAWSGPLVAMGLVSRYFGFCDARVHGRDSEGQEVPRLPRRLGAAVIGGGLWVGGDAMVPLQLSGLLSVYSRGVHENACGVELSQWMALQETTEPMRLAGGWHWEHHLPFSWTARSSSSLCT